MKSLAVVVLLTIVVANCHSDRSYPPGPSFLIEDGNHNGNAFFYWLAPLVQQDPPASQVFSKQLTPTIAITNLCTGNIIRTFAGSAVQLGDGAYQANWHTPDDNLDPTCIYRITVNVGSHPLGLADVVVVDSGDELKNVNTDQYIALLDGRTLPIKFFVGVGSLCDAGVSDCGEAVARPGINTTVVTTSGRAGVFIPAGAVTDDVTVTVQSVDNAAAGCIPGLLQQYSGSPNVDNSCYDYHATPLDGLTEQIGPFTFNSSVTVGICPPINALQGPHAVLDLLQIFQFDDFGSGNTLTQPLRNIPAPFLQCDPLYSPSFGSRRSLLGDVGRALASLIAPQPLFASTTRAAFDLGAGGSADGFSRFTWALPATGLSNFDVTPDLTAISPGAVINSAYSRIGVTFSRTGGGGVGGCQGTAVYANAINGTNTISLCPQGTPPAFSALSGVIVATFTVPVASACIDATPVLPQLPLLGGVLAGPFLEALGSDGTVIGRTSASATPQTQSICVSGAAIAAVRFAGVGTTLARFDNLSFSRIASP
ncbi:MAG TPA: hypothetical protein VGU74_11425 [Gemmatimonadales bacterium]|nr:hypothetical protein [Gemmatimonadales bacterium]